MMNIWTICGMALCALASIVVLREIRKEWTVWIVLCVMLTVMYFAMDFLKETVAIVREYADICPDISEYAVVLIKGLGTAGITYAAVEICRTAGENTLAGYVELAGKIELLLIGIPVFREILSIAVGLL